MRTVYWCAAGLLACVSLVPLETTWSQETGPAKADSKAKKTATLRRVPNFVLPNASGKQAALADYADAKVVVLVFMGTKCPVSNALIPDLNDLQKRYGDKQVQVVGINANPADTSDAIVRHVKEYSVGFPVLVDKEQLALDLTGAQRTPEAVVLDHRHQIRYRGRINDRVGTDYKREKANKSEVEDAVKELLAGKDVTVAEAGAQGCLITRASKLKELGPITYAKHVAPILQNRCAECHHAGTAAPFALMTYDEARDYSAMMKEVIVQRKMPPWGADPRHSTFTNDLRMTKNEIDTVVAWIDAGTPMGDKNDLPQPRVFNSDGWLIGKPDVIFKLPKEVTVQATGTVEYQYFVTPTNFKEDMWIQASEARPTNRAAVHHIIAFIREKGSEEMQKLPLMAGFAPGEEPAVYPQGIGFKVPAGAEIVWQIHYTPTGKVEKDRSEVGLIFCKEPPRQELKGGGVFNFRFVIPPGASSHREVAELEFKTDVELMTLMPHMHLRGKAFRYTANYPDGRKQVLLNVPDYDFNWQHIYRFNKPIAFPKGTVLECVAHFDNSADNPANPDPKKTVRWGDQTWEEMMIGWYTYVEVPAATK
ncbi:MAG TPA: redoxin domain-containing protein [Gemmatales bacterium]|nr:redoxin domain-containing protein [Gemmatales bacterium]